VTKLTLLIMLAPLTAVAAPVGDPVTAAVPQNKDGNVVLTSHSKTNIERVCYEAFFADGGKDHIDWECKEVSLAPAETEEIHLPQTCWHSMPSLTRLVVTSLRYAGGKVWVRPVAPKSSRAPVELVPSSLVHGEGGSKKGSCTLEHVVLFQNMGKKAVNAFSGEYRVDGKPQTITMDLADPIAAAEERPVKVEGTDFRLTSLTFGDGTSWVAH
jgi:hypothetical protein